MTFLPVVDASAYRPAMASVADHAGVWEWAPPQIVGPVPGRAIIAGPGADAIVRCAETSLQFPLDYPAIGDAIVAGDRVALAVDPNIPAIGDVLRGLINSLAAAGVTHVSVVFWAEASLDQLNALRQQLSEASYAAVEQEFAINVVRHAPADRSEHRYVIADEDAMPVYLSRHLVDADVVIPVVMARRDKIRSNDVTGLMPMFADASTVVRQLTSESHSATEDLLGIGLMVLVSADAGGNVRSILSGAPTAIDRELSTFFDEQTDAPEMVSSGVPTADLVVAALDGDVNAQSWANIARAASAAAELIIDGGSIVIWSHVSTPCDPNWQRELLGTSAADEDLSWENDVGGSPDHDASEGESRGELEDRLSTVDQADASTASTETHVDPIGTQLARQLASLCRKGTVWLHSELPRSDVEQLGLAVIDSIEELKHLASQRAAAGVLRAAAFHGPAVDGAAR
ncbi:MAG: transcriptional regulator [Planctomycetota bacterium]